MPTTINGVVKIRRGTAASLASVVLLDGELGYANDTKILKIGDGVTAFSALPTLETFYLKTEVESFIVEAMKSVAKAFGRASSSALAVPTAFINPISGQIITY